MLENRVLVSIALFITTIVLCGCGPTGPERAIVSGKVTYNGKPIPDGRIRFMPTKASEVPMSGTVIKDGQYCANTKGGVPVGTFQVQIEAYAENQATSEQFGQPSVHQQYLPRKFNRESQLEITIQPGDKKVNRDFELRD